MDILILEASTVTLGNGNRVTLENGNIVVVLPSIRVSEYVSVQVEALTGDLSIGVSSSVNLSENIILTGLSTARVYGPAIQMMG